jgi:hypothetical protein
MTTKQQQHLQKPTDRPHSLLILEDANDDHQRRRRKQQQQHSTSSNKKNRLFNNTSNNLIPTTIPTPITKKTYEYSTTINLSTTGLIFIPTNWNPDVFYTSDALELVPLLVRGEEIMNKESHVSDITTTTLYFFNINLQPLLLFLSQKICSSHYLYKNYHSLLTLNNLAILIQILTTIALLIATLIFALQQQHPDDVFWAGAPIYSYLGFACILVGAPLVCKIVLYSLVNLCRIIGISYVGHVFPNFLFAVFYIERLLPLINRVCYSLLYLIGFSVLFFQVSGTTEEWYNAYFYIRASLGTIVTWCVGRVTSKAITYSTTREALSRALIIRVKNCLIHEILIWEAINGIQLPPTAGILHEMENPLLLHDPRVSQKMLDVIRLGIMRATIPTSLLTTDASRSGEIELSEPRDGKIFGTFLFRRLMYLIMISDDEQPTTTVNTTDLPSHVQYLDLAVNSPTSSSSHNKKSTARTTFSLFLSNNNFDHMQGGVLPTNPVYSPNRVLLKHNFINTFITKRNGNQQTWLKIWDFFDPRGLGVCSLERMQISCAKMVSEWQNLSSTVLDTLDIMARFEMIVGGFINVVVFLIALSIFGLSATNVWIALSSVVISFSFVFDDTVKGLFASLVFIFGTHAFDVGDVIRLGPDGITYTVAAIYLNTTKLTRWDGATLTFSNPWLATQPVWNVSRSQNFEATFEFIIDSSSLPPQRDIDQMEKELSTQLAKRRSAYTGQCSITVRGVLEGLKVRLVFWIQFSFGEWDTDRANRERGRVIQFLVSMLRKRNITWSGKMAGVVGV